MTIANGSKLLVDALKENRAKHLFALVGSDTIPVFDVLSQTSAIQVIGVRHEQAAGHMADGYARVSREPGVCLVHNGPGLTNVLTGIAAAYRAFSPVVLISGAPTLSECYRDTIQELNQLAITRALVKWNGRVTRVDRIPEMVDHSFRMATSGRKGPVHLDVPRDLLLQTAAVEVAPRQPSPSFPAVLPSSEAIKRTGQLLVGAQRPLIIAGGGSKWADATDEIVKLAEILSIPMATSYGHLDAVPGDHLLTVGQLGRDGSRLARKLATEADVILAIGTRLSAFTTFFSNSYISPRAHIIQIDIEPQEIGRHHRVDIGIVGDAKAVTKALVMAIEENIRPGSPIHNTNRIRELIAMKEEWNSELVKLAKLDAVPIKPQSAFLQLQETIDRETIVVLDDGNAVAFGYRYLRFHEPRTFLSPLDLACVGSAFPTALGAKIAKPEKTVVAVCGDGGFSMMLHELATAVQHHINVTTVVLNNNCWAAEKAYQKYFCEGRYFGCDLVNPNFAEVAEKFGALGRRIERAGELRAALSEAFHADKPSVVEVMVDPDELSPPVRKDIMEATI